MWAGFLPALSIAVYFARNAITRNAIARFSQPPSAMRRR